MRKRIGTKVVSMLSILLIVFLCIILINSSVLKSIERTNTEITNVFLEIEAEKGEVSTAFQQIQLYANLSFYKAGGADIEIITGKLSAAVEELQTHMEAIDTLCQGAEDAELQERGDAWQAATLEFCNYASGIYDAAVSGDYSTVQIMADGIMTNKAPADEAQALFEERYDTLMDGLSTSSASMIHNARLLDFAMLFLFVVIYAFIIAVVMKTISSPAKEAGKALGEMIDKIAREEGDLTMRIPVKTSDEIGQMANGINGFIETLQALLRNLKRQAEELLSSAGTVSGQVAESNDSAGNISAAMEEMAASMQEISATVSQIASGSGNVLGEVQAMNQRARDGVSAVREIKDRASRLHQSTVDGKTRTNNTISEIKSSLLTALEESRSVEKINALTGDILDITSQTNLLSLNASIEAARAGEAGRGFAVVAGEIRSLADSSADTANNIQNIIGQVTAAVESLAENAERILQCIDEEVLRDYDDFVEVAAKYESDADSMNQMLSMFSESTEDINETITSMNTGLNDIAAAVDDNAQGIATAAESAVSLVAAMNRISEEIAANREISNQLDNEVSRFKKL